MKQSILLIISILFSLNLSAQKDKKLFKDYKPTDQVKDVPKPYDYQVNKNYTKIESTSMYLEMRDGNRIAMNVSLPKGLEPGTKIPTILYQTRYWRGAAFRWPFSMFLDNFVGATGKLIKEVVLNGYAFVAVDSRGSGASFGTRDYPWHDDEVKDGAEIVDWIIAQEWSNGKVGTAGVSYSGTTAEFLAVNQHPAVKASVPMFSLFDVYDDIAFPNGINFEFFTKNWGLANDALDANKLPAKARKARWVLRGVQPVKGEKKTLKQAIASHKDNLNVHEGAKTVVYIDDPAKNRAAAKTEIFSPYFYQDELNNSGTAFYSISGWYDGDYQHAAIKRHLTLTNPQNKLMLGPWEHGGQMNCSPHNPGPAGFDLLNEILKFFDYHLKDKGTGIYEEPGVHYFTMGEEKWKSAESWPPAGTTDKDFHFAKGNRLSENPAQLTEANFYEYQVDTTCGTGDSTRWKSVFGMLKTPFAYKSIKEHTKKMLTFTGTPLEEATEVTGHGIVTLQLSTEDRDGAVFVYLLDVSPEGEVFYVTEGSMRFLHRKISDEADRPHADVVPYHSFLKEDGQFMLPGQIEELTFDLLPVSYLFKPGHKMMIGITCADKDHFKILDSADDKIKIYIDPVKASKVTLPIMKRN